VKTGRPRKAEKLNEARRELKALVEINFSFYFILFFFHFFLNQEHKNRHTTK
jgi:hypothetical protein